MRVSPKKEAACVATSGLSLGRKRPRRAYAADHAAPQQYRNAPHQMQDVFWRHAARGVETAANARSPDSSRSTIVADRIRYSHTKQCFMKSAGIIGAGE